MRTSLVVSLSVFLTVFASGCRARRVAPARALRWENPSPVGVTLRGACVTPDGTVWAVGEVGTLLSRTNGAWTRREVRAEDDLHAVACCPSGDVIAVGDRGLVATVSAGRTRVERRGDAMFLAVACGRDDTAVSITNTPAMHVRDARGQWTSATAPARFVSLATDGTRWFAGAVGGGIFHSARGVGPYTEAGASANAPPLSFAFDGPRVVGVGAFGTTVVSDDGARWERINSGTTDDLFFVHRDARGFLAVGSGAALRSSDGRRWEREPGELPSRTHAVATVGGSSLALGVAGAISTRDGGAPWSALPSMRSTLFGVWADRSTRIAVGRAGTLLRQERVGGAWQPIATDAVFDLRGVTGDARGTVLVVGDNATVLRSTDRGRTFRKIDLGQTDALYAVWLDAAGHAIAVGPGLCARSPDAGQHWVTSALPRRQSVGALAYDGEWLWMGGDRGYLRRTRDFGLLWEDVALPRPVDVQRIVARGPERVLLFTKQSAVLERGADGRWTERSIPAEVVYAAARVGGAILATSFGGGIYRGEGDPLRWTAVRRLSRDSVFDVTATADGDAWLVGEWGTILAFR
jgi:hypothetical protein